MVFWGVLRLLFKNSFKSLNHEKLCKFPNDGRFRKAKPMKKRVERKRGERKGERKEAHEFWFDMEMGKFARQ